MLNFRDKSLGMRRHTYTRTTKYTMKLLEKTLAFSLGSMFMVFGQDQNQDSILEKERTQLEEVVLKDLKTPFGFDYQGATQFTLDSSDLKPFRTRGVGAALNSLAGIEVNGSRATTGAVMGIYARGGRGKQTLLLIDGIRMADPSSASLSYDLRLLDINQIASIKIIKGANSSLFGTNAATLVIDITTKKAANKPIRWEGSATTGTHRGADQASYNQDYSQWSNYFSGAQSGWTYSLSLSAQRTKGLSSFKTPLGSEDPFRQDAQRLVIGKKWSTALRSSFFFDRQFMFASYDDAFMGVDAPNSFRTIKNSGGSQWAWQNKNQYIKFNFGLNSYESVDKSAFGSEVTASNINSELLYKTFFKKYWNLTAGFQVIQDQIKENEIQGTSGSEYWITDPYFSLGFKKQAFQFQTGARFNYHSAYKGQWVYHINPSLFIDSEKQYRFYAGLSSAYITPTLGMFFGPYGANENLQAETNQNAEIGLAFDNRKGVQWGLTYFDRKEQQAIYFNGPAFLYENNSQDTWARGFETQFQLAFISNVKLQANYSYIQVSESAIRIPKHKANMNILYTPKADMAISLHLSFTGSRKDTDFSTYADRILDAFTLLDAQYSFPITKNIGGSLSINNILNTDFEETIGYQTLGRNIRFGIDWRL